MSTTRGLLSKLCCPRRRRAEAWSYVYASTFGRDEAEEPEPTER